ncbi:hypothetical protein RXV86_18730 [Alisedimentitalea sp. MJ-SS2]|uniref:hypothetical protein n=1 Tax=Aliisedimentitalea sp. MJ-SS2 TaxID=3049795 RepID=UPI00290C3D06|nr:hypothetical protein [Alisedimentitalea sp. MJ-SS2]MDU8929428.1 hypothetical protein [Alisedimentitalea sp. MJ-SS2]
MSDTRRYVGIQNDLKGGMTDTGKIIRDAWVFGFIPETETCEGWLAAGIEDLWRKVNAEWEKHGFLVSNLPPDLRERFDEIHNAAVAQARAAGWDGEAELADDT